MIVFTYSLGLRAGKKESEDRIRELEKILALLVFCEDAEFYPSAIEKSSPYCIDFEKWHEDACEILKGRKENNYD